MDKDSDTADQELTSYLQDDGERSRLEHRYLTALEARVAQLDALLKSAYPPDLDAYNRQNEGLKNGLDASASDPDEAPSTPSIRVQTVTGRYNYARRFHEYCGTKGVGGLDPWSCDKSRLPKDKTIVQKVLDDDMKLLREEIEIDSVELRRLLTQTVKLKVYPEDETEPVLVKSPFAEFVWFWNDFEAACEPTLQDSPALALARKDLTQLMDILRTSQLEPYFKIRESSLNSGMMPYEYLWTLFPKGTKVYAKTFLGELQMLEVRRCDSPVYSERGDDYELPSYYRNGGTSPKNQPEWTHFEFRITCGGFDWDGAQFNTFTYEFTISKDHNQATSIDSLPVFPVHFFRNQDGEKDDVSLRKSLVDRGKIFSDLCTSEARGDQYRYNGNMSADSTVDSALVTTRASHYDDDDATSLYSGMDESSSYPASRSRYSYASPKKVLYRGVALIDAEAFPRTYKRPCPSLGDLAGQAHLDAGCKCNTCQKSPLTQWLALSRGASKSECDKFKANEERLMMCPPRVLGYALKLKMWAQLRVTLMQKIDFGNGVDYFQEQLQLDHDHKRMLLAFITDHERNARSEDPGKLGRDEAPRSLDIIEGKGQGLAILLHGPPGVGKTLTAETIALATQRPLLTVSVAEIGTNASQAEGRLNTIFTNATRWRAVLLVDEADVFLEARGRTDNPNRNALVSVLLRCLEYYEGIIILTTNRIKSIDVAVQSRMHLAIQYKNLTTDQMWAIYKNLLADVPDSRIRGSRSVLELEVKKQLCSRRPHMNGRQIRNIVTTARALASSESQKLHMEHLRQVYDSTADFLEGLKEINDKALRNNQVDEA